MSGPLAQIGLLLAVLAAGSPAAAPREAAATRGEMLYENHCTACHTSVMHVRTDRRATSPAEVEAYVRRWAGRAGPGWSAEEEADVAAFLLERYYRFDAPRK